LKIASKRPNFKSNQYSLNSESSDSENYSENIKLKSRNNSLGANISNENTTEDKTSENRCAMTKL